MITHSDLKPNDGENFEFLNIQDGGRPMPGLLRCGLTIKQIKINVCNTVGL